MNQFRRRASALLGPFGLVVGDEMASASSPLDLHALFPQYSDPYLPRDKLNMMDDDKPLEVSTYDLWIVFDRTVPSKVSKWWLAIQALCLEWGVVHIETHVEAVSAEENENEDPQYTYGYLRFREGRPGYADEFYDLGKALLQGGDPPKWLKDILDAQATKIPKIKALRVALFGCFGLKDTKDIVDRLYPNSPVVAPKL